MLGRSDQTLSITSRPRDINPNQLRRMDRDNLTCMLDGSGEEKTFIVGRPELPPRLGPSPDSGCISRRAASFVGGSLGTFDSIHQSLALERRTEQTVRHVRTPTPGGPSLLDGADRHGGTPWPHQVSQPTMPLLAHAAAAIGQPVRIRHG
ncbi:hypothetical protein CMUS01_11981 [Colletotrichum musicola]|uniref:Uncharacterized protein n=1 Tax=Colletotrichum musicola TaxID=2175873 RepID=A0A8H6JRK4_9PEZI|nr:hypothetical protein CMUS01_11981 [Colletotrichum musicola]